MCLTNDQKMIDEKAEHDAMALMVVVICAFTLLGAVIGFIGCYSACKVATAQTVPESFSNLTGEVSSITVEEAR